MLRKGFDVGFVVVVIGTILGGTALYGASDVLLDDVRERGDAIEDQVGGPHVELSDNPILAREQLRATTYHVTLRSVHCQILYNALYGGVWGEDYDPEGFDGSENPHADVLIWTLTLEEESVRDWECRGGDNIWHVSGVDDAIEKAEEAYECVDDLGGCASSAVKESATDGLETMGEALWDEGGVFGSVTGGYVNYEDEEDIECLICDDPGNSQPGRFGNVGFTYPQGADSPLVIDAEEHPLVSDDENNAWIGIRDFVYLEDGDYKQSYPEIPENWNAYSGADERFWRYKTVHFAPDSDIASKAVQGSRSFNFEHTGAANEFGYSSSGAEYNLKPYRPAMENVPLIVKKPLYMETDDFSNTVVISGDNHDHPANEAGAIIIDYDYSSASTIPLFETATPGLETEIEYINELQQDFFDDYYGNTDSYDDFFRKTIDADFGSKGTLDLRPDLEVTDKADMNVEYPKEFTDNFEPPYGFDDLPESIHQDYEFVICPGSEGRIQSNVGDPYYDGSQQHSIDDTEGTENVAFPFVELNTRNDRCVTDHELEYAGGWDIESPHLSTGDCESYSDLGSSYLLNFPDSLEEDRCGVRRLDAGTQEYWKFQNYRRTISHNDDAESIFDFEERLNAGEEEIGYLNIPEDLDLRIQPDEDLDRDWAYDHLVTLHGQVAISDNFDYDITGCGEEASVIEGGQFYKIIPGEDNERGEVQCFDDGISDIKQEMIEDIEDLEEILSGMEDGESEKFEPEFENDFGFESCIISGSSEWCFADLDETIKDVELLRAINIEFKSSCDENYFESSKDYELEVEEHAGDMVTAMEVEVHC